MNFLRMKLFLTLLLLLIFFTNCQKLFHPEEISIGKITNYDQLVSATDGVYASLTLPLFYSIDFYSANLKGDDLNYSQAVYNFSGNQQNCYNAGSGDDFPFAAWTLLYSTIVSVNNIINQYNPVLIKDVPTKEILGEMYLIRAYCHFRLTRVYGEIPIINNIDISYSIKKSTYAQIYSFIESDLKMAMELLPKNNSSARIPFITPHRGSAKAILAEVYLSWAGYPANDASKYLFAAKEAGETIDSASFFGLGLVNDFAYLWDKPHLYNAESVFSLYCSTPLIKWSLQRGLAFYSGKFNDPVDYVFNLTSNIRLSIDFFPVEINFYNNYPAGYRKEITFYTTIYYNNPQYDSLGNIIHVDSGYLHINTVNICSRMAYRKFYYDSYEKNYKLPFVPGSTDSVEVEFYFGIPRVYIFRYAQTVLTYAEAMARSGQPDAKAYECVNEIRRRAHHLNLNLTSIYDLPSGLSPTTFADSVVQERAWELCGEPEGRWFDLVRLEMVEDLPKLRNPNEGGSTFWGLR